MCKYELKNEYSIFCGDLENDELAFSRYGMPECGYTPYFENKVLRKRPYLKKEWCIRVLKNPVRVERQDENRFRFWGRIEELGDRVLRVVTLEDKITIHNAFLDRGFKE